MRSSKRRHLLKVSLVGPFPTSTHSWKFQFSFKKFSRLQAVPFWLVERVRSQRSETGARRNKREETGGEDFPFPFFPPLPKSPSARLLQFFRARLFRATSGLSRKGLLAVQKFSFGEPQLLKNFQLSSMVGVWIISGTTQYRLEWNIKGVRKTSNLISKSPSRTPPPPPSTKNKNNNRSVDN